MSDAGRSIYQDFEFLQPLAEGGMGTVFLAEDRRNSTRCVIKQLRTIAGASEDEIQEAERLFDREALILKKLDHPGIVSFMDSYRAHEDGRSRFFLVMSYVTGNNLETVLQNYGKFTLDDTIKVGIQICEVLEHLHELDEPIIYRDLKPSNLMLTPEGQIIFIDFGIARVLMPDSAATRVVTAGYSPPEQYFGRPEFRSDLYALGATLSHLVTGVRSRPLITSVPSQHIPDILPNFDQLIRELTAHSPAQRPDSARNVRHRLYKIFQEIHPDFEIPDELFTSSQKSTEDQFISRKIMKSGLKVAESSAKENWTQARGPELESYTDENMPSAMRKLAESWQRLSSTKIPKFDPNEHTKEIDDLETKQAQSTSITNKLKNSFDKHESKPTIWKMLLKWFKGG